MKELILDQTQQKSRDVSILRIHPYTEPLLWLQLLGGTLLPIESLIISLIESGTHWHPFPTINRLIVWLLGTLLPTVLLWYRPLNCWSLLFVQIPTQNRSLQQQALSLLRYPLWLKLLQASIALPLLVLIEKLDQISSQISTFSIFSEIPYFFRLMTHVILLVLITCQWQQFIQAAWLMLTGHKHYYVNKLPLDSVTKIKALDETLSLGLPILDSATINILNSNDPKGDVSQV